MNIIKKFLGFTSVLTILGMLVLPTLSFAQTYPAPIADRDILISVTSPTSARITWTTSAPTTSVVWYSGEPYSSNATLQYSNMNEGYVMFHTVHVSGIDLQTRHTFRVGGLISGSSVQITSGQQLI